MLSRQGSVSPEKRGILPSCFLEAREDEKRDRDRDKGAETGHGKSQPKNITVDTQQAIVHSGRFSEKISLHTRAVLTESRLCCLGSQTSRFPSIFSCLVESFTRTLFLHPTSHLVSHSSHPLDLATRLCMQPVRKAAAEGIYKQGMWLNQIIHYRILKSDWLMRSGWRPLHNIYILLFCDKLIWFI